MAKPDDLTECLRCGAMVDRMAKHKRWHEQLEGTSAQLPPAAPKPGDMGGAVW